MVVQRFLTEGNMSYMIYLYALAAVAVAGVCCAVFLLLPTACVYYLASKYCKQRKWVGIVTSVLLGVFGGGYLYMTVFGRFMDYLCMIIEGA